MKQFRQFIKEDMIDDFEIRFGKESDWKKADKLVQAYLRIHAPKHAKVLFKKTYVHGPDPLMVAFGDTKKKLNPPVNLNKLYNAIRKLPSSRDKYWDSIPKNKEKDAIGEGAITLPLKKSQQKALKIVLKKPLKAKDAYKAIEAYVDDDELMDKIGALPGNKDARPVIIKWLSKYGPTKNKSWASLVGIAEGTMRSGIFDSDLKKRKDAARKLVFFLKQKRNLRIGPMNDKQGGSNKAIDSYIKELMKYVFDDLMIDDLYPTGKNANVKANDVVVKRLKKMGVKVK